jgi:RNA polymerase sigma-54 factor
MSISMKQSMELRQTLRMTPQLQQAIKLLQLSRMELEAAVRKELEENPILEEGMEVSNSEVSKEPVEQESSDIQDPQKQDEFDWESYLESNTKTPGVSTAANEEILNYENLISTTETTVWV